MGEPDQTKLAATAAESVDSTASGLTRIEAVGGRAVPSMADFAACTVTPVIENSNRVEQFRAEIAAMHVKDPATGRETALLRLGVLLMVGGVVLTLVSYFASHSTKLALDQGDDTILALVGVGLTISGSALFLRYSLANFFRFWLARLIFEQRAATDRLAGRDEK